MKEDFQGLRIAAPKTELASGAGAEAIAFADLKADQIVAAMSDEQKAAVTASLAPKAEEEPAAKDKGKGKKKDEAEADEGPKDQASFDAGFAAATARATTVLASQHFAGHETQAAKLLANPKLSADEIVEMLADMPDGDGAKMLDAIKAGNNPKLGSGEGGGSTSGSNSADNHGWGKAHANVAKRYGRSGAKKQ